MKTVRVEASKSYNIYIEKGLLDKLGELMSELSGVKSPRLCLVCDSNVDKLYGERAMEALRSFECIKFVFPAGEESKNLSTYASLLDFMCENELDRGDMIVALGGGVTGDLSGFAASTYLRGIRFVQVPTTVLAAVDSSVGGKTAVDLAGGKNLCGTFYQPEAVYCDPDLFDTLPNSIFSDGMAEAVKYAFIHSGIKVSDFAHLTNGRPDNIEDIIAACVSIKAEVVSADERDLSGKRALLNFGHTPAHAIEKCSDYKISHGAAVAMGMVIMTRAAAKRGLCSPSLTEGLIKTLKSFSLELDCPYSAEKLAPAAMNDKKRTGAYMSLIIPRSEGVSEIKRVPLEEIEAFFADGIQ